MHNRVNILVVEDETLLAKDIAIRLEKMGYQTEYQVASVDDAVRILENFPIDLALIDIKLKGALDGIDLGQLINHRFQIPFVFLTSHADKQLVDRAKKVRPYAYMLKPFNDKEIQIAIELALANFANKTTEIAVSRKVDFSPEDNQILDLKGSLFLKKNDHFQKVNLNSILWLEADSNYTKIHTNNETFVYATVLKKIEEKLPKSRFIRVHRSFIVNVENVTGFVGNLLYVEQHRIPVSKAHQNDVFRIFKTI